MEVSEISFDSILRSFQNVFKRQNNFSEHLQNLLNHLKNLGIPDIEVFAKIIGQTSYSKKTACFLFSRFLRFFSRLKNKSPEIYRAFLNLTLKFAGKYIRLDAISQSKSKEFSLFRRALDFIPEELIFEEIVKSFETKKTYLFMKWVELRKKPELIEKIAEFIENKLKDEYFIDLNARKPTGFRFVPAMRILITPKKFKEFYLPTMFKLIRRSENNMDIVKDIFSACLELDMSEFAEEILFTNLNEFFFTKSQEICVLVAQKVIAELKNFEVCLKIIKKLENIMNTTNNEQNKMTVLQMFEGFFVNAARFKNAERNSLQKEFFAICLNNFSMLNQEELIPTMQKTIESFINNSLFFVLDAKEINSLKNNILSQKNKFALMSSLSFLSKYLQKFINEQHTFAELFVLVDTINTQIIAMNFKTPQKLVTNYASFLVALEIVCLSYQKKELSKNVKFETLCTNFFNENILMHQSKFLQKANPQELSQLMQILVSILYYFQEENQEILENEENIVLISNTITQILLEKNFPLSSVEKILKALQGKPREILMKLICKGLFSRCFFTEITEVKELEKIRVLIKYLIRDFQLLDTDEHAVFFSLFLIYHEEVSTKHLLSTFLKKMQAEPLIKERICGFCEKKSEDLMTVLFSSYGVFSKKRTNVKGFISFTKAFIDFGHEDFINFFNLFLDETNFYEGDALDKFEENFPNSKENNCFLPFVENYGQFLCKLGFLEKNSHVLFEEYSNIANINVKEKEKAAVSKKKDNKKTKKTVQSKQETGKKVELLDEEEIAKLRLEQLHSKMFYYYEKIVLIVSVYSSRISQNPKASLIFYKEILQRMIQICKNKLDFRGGFLDILQIFYKNNASLKRFHLVLAEIIVKKLDHESPREIYQEDFIKLLQFLPEYVDENKHPESIDFWQDLMVYFIRNKEFDLKIKNLSLNFLFSLAKMQILQEKLPDIYEELIQNINALANFDDLIINFLVFLLPKMNKSSLKIMFENILEVSEKAKESCLKSVILVLPTISKDLVEISFEIIMKIRIMKLSYDKNLANLCEKLLSLINYEDNIEDINKFQIKEFIKNNSKENLDDFCQILADLIQNKAISTALFKMLIGGTKEVLLLEKPEDDKFLFFPQFLMKNLPKIEEAFFEDIFSIIIEYLCHENNKILTEKALEIGKELIKFYGGKFYEKFSSFLNVYLDKKTLDKSQQVCTVVFIGVLSPYISNMSKVKEITNKIMELLESSSENQQANLSKCISDMIIFFPDAEKIIETHLNSIFTEKTRNKQRYSAFLIAGLVRGLGISAIESMKILEKLESQMEGILKKDLSLKEGVLNLTEALCEINGKLLEPYISRILTLLIQFFGENNEAVRDQSLHICSAAISKLSSFGVKNVLPLLLKGLDEKSMNWRAKLANISTLGNLAYCSPKQLSLSLPQIIPKLTATLSDTHPKIREGADEALKVIGKTIKNPEISENVDILIKAINNPFDENKKGLEVLLKTQFVHYIDIPALSLIIPIIDYGLRSRESLLKENASQIVGTISHLIKDQIALLPYLDILVNALKISVCDPIGEVRNISAKAFGALAKKLGETHSSKIIRTLKGILESPDSKNNEKAGAAQAYAEVICAIGGDYFERVKDYILSKTLENKQYLKESYIGVFIYLPGIMEEAFEPYLSTALDHLVESLSEENESIRSLTLRVVKILIERFGLKNTHLLLAPINDGLFNINMRKRNSSINLTGELLKVLYRSRNSAGNEQVFNRIYEETLANVYILKHDEYESIKNTADNVWKENVNNTPKILKQILPVLIRRLIELMTLETGIEKLAINTIKEYCGKYSDSIFFDFLNILEQYSKDEEASFQGIYLTLNQFVREAHPSTIHKNSMEILSLLRAKMVCSEDLIRKSVYLTYNSYLEKFSDAKPLAETLEPFFEKMETLDENSDLYEDYLKVFDEFIGLNNQKILNYLLGILFQRPLKNYRIEIITNNATILGNELYYNNTIEDIIPRMYEEIFLSMNNKSRLESLLYCLCQLSINVNNENIMKFIYECLEQIKKYKEKSPEKLIIILDVMKFFFQNTLADFAKHVPEFLYYFIPFLFVEKPEMSAIINVLLKALLKTQEKDLCSIFLTEFYSKLSSALVIRKDQSSIYAMNQESGLEPYINILINSLVYGLQNDCETALKFYQLILNVVRVEFISPYTLKLVGPLIRVANYNYEMSLKVKIIEVLNKMHQLKLPIKVFESQLQLTYFRLIKESKNEMEPLNLLMYNVLDLMKNSKRKDSMMNELFFKFKETVTDETGRNGYLFVINKALKNDLEFFSKALVENLFQQLLNVGLLEINSVETVYDMGKTLGLTSTFAKKSLVKDAILREANVLIEENKEDFENNPNEIEKYKALSNILGIYSNKRYQYDEEIHSWAEKNFNDIYLGLNNIKEEHLVYCVKFFRKIHKNKEIKDLIFKKKYLESMKKEVKEYLKDFDFL